MRAFRSFFLPRLAVFCQLFHRSLSSLSVPVFSLAPISSRVWSEPPPSQIKEFWEVEKPGQDANKQRKKDGTRPV